jgi:methyltransferase
LSKKKLAIALPASVISDTPHLREKTAKIGLIGRAAAIFRVDEIYLYQDNPQANQKRDLQFIELLLNYLETPQYLRKTLFRIEPDLQYAGILPPLRTPNHPLSGKIKHLKVGEYREGIVLSENREGLLVDIGVDRPAILREKQFGVNQRLTLQVVHVGEKIEVQVVSRDDVPTYWGFRVVVWEQSFSRLLESGGFDLKIATSKIGEPFKNTADKIGKRWGSAEHVLVAFGPPSRGLNEIAEAEGKQIEHLADFVVNTVPAQGTATVRTEEALLASLALFNVYFNS